MKPTVKKQARSAVSNGKRLFADATIDRRGIWARRFRDLVLAYADDLGGLDRLSAVQLGLVRRAASLSVAGEKLEAKLATGEVVDWDALSRLSSNFHRISETLGIGKRKAPEELSLADILRAHQEAPEKPTLARQSVAATILPPEHETPISGAPTPTVEAAE